MVMISIGLYVVYILMFIAVGSAIVFPLINAIKTPGAFGKSLIGVGALVVVFLIAYAISSSEVTTQQAAIGVTPSTVKLIGAGLTMFYIVLFVAIVGMIYSEINKALK